MKTINCFRDLEEYGIHPLTGEADNLSFRLLCDVDIRGYKILCEALGMVYHQPTMTDDGPLWDNERFHPPGWAQNWNSGSKDHPSVASIMLSDHMIEPIAIIALLTRGGCHTVLTTTPTKGWHGNGTIGLTGEESYTPAPYDRDSGEYTGPVRVNLDHFGERDWPECYGEIKRVFKTSEHPHHGTRNVHAMTGRSL